MDFEFQGVILVGIIHPTLMEGPDSSSDQNIKTAQFL